jgi:multidrug efflux pump subunit AcrA (membrane-fusion protein)
MTPQGRSKSTRRRAALVFAVLGLAVAATTALLVAGCDRETASATEYYCPMHPTYVSDRPGDCPICNMRLEPRPQPTAHARVDSAPGEHAMHTVPGRATVTLDAGSRALAGVQTAAATRERLVRRVRTVGTVRTDEGRLQHVHVKVGGFVEKLYVRTMGQLVRRGEPAFELFSPELVASQEEYLRALQAARELPASALPAARRGVEDLIAAARRRLELFDVPAEFVAELERGGVARRVVTMPAHASGYVVAKNVVEGDQVDPGMELYTLADLSRVWVEAELYENEASLVRIGQTASLALPSDPERRLAGTVAYIAPYVRPTSRTLAVRFEFANPDLALKPAMFADVWLEVASEDGVVVPESALIDTGDRRIVFVVLPGQRFEPREVRTGLRSEGRVQIVSGLAGGDSVVVRANFLLDSESRLRGALGAGSGAAHGSHTEPQP